MSARRKSPKKPATPVQLELNRWCIERAMQWPIVSVGGYTGAFQHTPRADSDAEVIGRAKKIKAWVMEGAL